LIPIGLFGALIVVFDSRNATPATTSFPEISSPATTSSLSEIACLVEVRASGCFAIEVNILKSQSTQARCNLVDLSLLSEIRGSILDNVYPTSRTAPFIFEQRCWIACNALAVLEASNVMSCQLEYLQTIKSSGNLLNNLIDSIFVGLSRPVEGVVVPKKFIFPSLQWPTILHIIHVQSELLQV
jgi:hypothetical protein